MKEGVIMKIAFYQAKYGNKLDKLIAFWTHGSYSHVELIFDEWWYTSSPRDGGVRAKEIKPTDHWHFIDLKVDNFLCRKTKLWFFTQQGIKYDYLGAVFGLKTKNRWYCSEICATMLKMMKVYDGPIRINVNNLWKYYN